MALVHVQPYSIIEFSMLPNVNTPCNELTIAADASSKRKHRFYIYKQTCLASAFATAPHTGSIRPPNTLISCNLLPTVQLLPSLHFGPCIHCKSKETSTDETNTSWLKLYNIADHVFLKKTSS